ncbi:MAG: hypothetical protein ACJ8EY_02650 [Sphingomicrobium sp.]
MVIVHPPRPRLTLNVGITGHRASILPPNVIEELAPIVDGVFQELRAAAVRLHSRESAIFDSAPPQLRLHTPLATGADQLAARSARASQYHVRALLPFAPDDYRSDFAEGAERDEFERELAAADRLFALPGQRGNEEGAYVVVGKAVVAAADILVAIWDGREGNGPGGTAHVVNLALANWVPVIHVIVDRDGGAVSGPRLLVGGDTVEPIVKPLACPDDYEALLSDTLVPHTSEERGHIQDYFAEVSRRRNWRIEYPMLLAALGVKSLPPMPLREAAPSHHPEVTAGIGQPTGQTLDIHCVAAAYEWANVLAIRYAQLFRSGHVANYVLSALAVLLALFGLLVPSIKVYLVIAELGTIGLLFLNTSSGTTGDWHRRWLQYRHLAESLRPLSYLKCSGLISTPFRSDFVQGAAHREAGADWTRWYAAAIWREMDSPTGIVSRADIEALVKEFTDEQIVPQAQYHRVNADRMYKLDHRLHEVGNFLTGAVIAVCALFLVGYNLVHHWVVSLTNSFIFLTAGLPAVGAAVFGLRGHGEHLLAASRSANTASSLEATATRLGKANDAEGLAHEFEHAASIMLADLNEWTISYRERSLEIPA